jgi:hypothetical protein
MGWLDRLLGRDKEDAGEPAAASTSMEESQEPAGLAEDRGPHEGHNHAPGEPHEHPHEENA